MAITSLELEKILRKKGNEIFRDPDVITVHKKKWEALGHLYKINGSDNSENDKTQQMMLILDIFLLCGIIWMINNKIKTINSLDDLNEIFLDAQKQKLLFDSKFKNHIHLIISTSLEINLDLKFFFNLYEKLNLKAILDEDELGTIIQNLLPSILRKSLAANYTSLFIANFIAEITITYEKLDKKIIDPFAGSSRLLTPILKLADQVANKINFEVNELFDLAALLGVLRLLFIRKNLKSKPTIVFHLGDAFSKIPKPLDLINPTDVFQQANLVVMNPPFTRYLRLTNEFLKSLQNIFSRYQKFMYPQMGLHIFAIFLADAVLKPNGRIIAILPASTFYSKYSDGLKELILTNYNIEFIIGTSTNKAFSEGSKFKEIILIARKRQKNQEKSDFAVFVTLNQEISQNNYLNIVTHLKDKLVSNTEYFQSRTVSYTDLKDNWNWIRYLEHGDLHHLTEMILNSGLIKSGADLELRIVRGFEMYGPDFFFLPNNDWESQSGDENKQTYIHKINNQTVSFPSSILLPALRKPGLYTDFISPEIKHVVLRVKKEEKDSVPHEYISERQNYWLVAQKRFGPLWLHHIDAQLTSKKPFGHLFVVDKFGITTTGTFIHYFDEPITASKNFYLIDCDKQKSKFLAAWMTSTLFILLFLGSRREIGGSFGRLQIVDYYKEPVF
ncbi:MAG: Eco57I restriction-modification methylase domain-containing protein, partial [Candidatus Hodarchaeales archaeon]